MKNKWLVIAVAATLSSAAFAQDTIIPNIDMGTKSLDVSGSFDASTPSGNETILNLGYGYFIQDALQLGGIIGVEDNDVYTSYLLGAKIEYNFDLGSQWVPFVGGGAYWARITKEEGDAEESTGAARLEGGIKYFLRNDLALTLSGTYDKALDDVFIDEDGITDYQFLALFGIRYYFD